MANYKLNQSGEQIQADLNKVESLASIKSVGTGLALDSTTGALTSNGITKVTLVYDDDTETWNHTAAEVYSYVQDLEHYQLVDGDGFQYYLMYIDEEEGSYTLINLLNYTMSATALMGIEDADDVQMTVNANTIITGTQNAIDAPISASPVSEMFAINSIEYSNNAYNIGNQLFYYLAMFAESQPKMLGHICFTGTYNNKIVIANLAGVQEGDSDNEIKLRFCNGEVNVYIPFNTSTKVASAPVYEAGGGGGTDAVLENAKTTGGIGWTTSAEKTTTWDGDITGKTSIQGMFYKISTDTPALSNIMGKKVISKVDGTDLEETITEDSDIEVVGTSGYIGYFAEGNHMLIVCFEPVTYYGISIEEPGIYFSKEDSTNYVSSLTYTNNTYHKISSNYVSLGDKVDSAQSTNGLGYILTGSTTDEYDKYSSSDYDYGDLTWRSANMPVISALAGKKYTITVGSTETEYTIASDLIVSNTDGSTCIYRSSEKLTADEPDIIIAERITDDFGATGIYAYTKYIWDQSGYTWVSEFSYDYKNTYQIAEKYIPNGEVLQSAINTGGIGYDKITATYKTTWDGDTTGKTPIIMGNESYYKIYDESPTSIYGFLNGVVYMCEAGEIQQSITLTQYYIDMGIIGEYTGYLALGDGMMYYVYADSATIEGQTFTKGIYTFYDADDQDYYNILCYGTETQLINSRFISGLASEVVNIPDTIVTQSDSNTYIVDIDSASEELSELLESILVNGTPSEITLNYDSAAVFTSVCFNKNIAVSLGDVSGYLQAGIDGTGAIWYLTFVSGNLVFNRKTGGGGIIEILGSDE